MLKNALHSIGFHDRSGSTFQCWTFHVGACVGNNVRRGDREQWRARILIAISHFLHIYMHIWKYLILLPVPAEYRREDTSLAGNLSSVQNHALQFPPEQTPDHLSQAKFYLQDCRVDFKISAGVQVTGSRTLLLRHQCLSGWWMAFGMSMRSLWPSSGWSLSWWPQYNTGEKCSMWVCPWEDGDSSISPRVYVTTHSWHHAHWLQCETVHCGSERVWPILIPYESLANLTHSWLVSNTVSFLKFGSSSTYYMQIRWEGD